MESNTVGLSKKMSRIWLSTRVFRSGIGLTDTWHPTQMIADFMTLKESFGSLENLTIAYIGDGRNNISQLTFGHFGYFRR